METGLPLLLATVSILSALQMVHMAVQVGKSRIAFKILPPTVTGPPEFERTFRAHQNSVEFYPLFLVALWTCGTLFHEVSAAGGGILYIVARQMYFNGYVKSTKKRLPGFYMTLAIFTIMTVLSSIGIFRGILFKYFDIHV